MGNFYTYKQHKSLRHPLEVLCYLDNYIWKNYPQASLNLRSMSPINAEIMEHEISKNSYVCFLAILDKTAASLAATYVRQSGYLNTELYKDRRLVYILSLSVCVT
jgi:hypothetical protein